MEAEVIEELSRTFSDHIRSPNEVSNIRRCLAAYVHRLLDEACDECNADGSAFTQSDLAPNRLPKELTGLRRHYLEAQRNNLKARQDRVLLAETAKRQRSIQTASTYGGSQSSSLEAHLWRLRAHELSRQLTALQRRSRALDPEPAVGALRPQTSPDKDRVDLHQDLDLYISSTDLSSTLEQKLQCTALQANHRLEREQKLLAEINSRIAAVEPEVQANSATRLHALSATRDELVRWLEGHLARHNEAETEPQQQSTPIVSHGPTRALENISSHYKEYVVARERVLRAARAAACRLHDPEAVRVPGHVKSETLKPTTPPSSTLFVEKQLVPLKLQQRVNTTQMAYRSARMIREKLDTNEITDRLVHESHLLPTYPLGPVGAVQPLEARGRLDGESLQPGPAIEQSDAWAFAAEKAGQALQLSVANHLAHAKESTTAIESNFSDLRIGNMDDSIAKEVIHRKHLSPRPAATLRQNHWSQLHGDLGTDGHA